MTLLVAEGTSSGLSSDGHTIYLFENASGVIVALHRDRPHEGHPADAYDRGAGADLGGHLVLGLAELAHDRGAVHDDVHVGRDDHLDLAHDRAGVEERLEGRELRLAEVEDHSTHHREGAVVLGHRPDALTLALAHDRDGRVVPDGGHR